MNQKHNKQSLIYLILKIKKRKKQEINNGVNYYKLRMISLNHISLWYTNISNPRSIPTHTIPTRLIPTRIKSHPNQLQPDQIPPESNPT